mgnify:CR=1 FL=1
MQFSYRLFEQGSDTLLAISDADIVGKTIRGGELEVVVSKDFYSGKACGENEAIAMAKKATIVNAMGKVIINLLSEKGLVDKEMVLMIGDVPHAQLIAIRS